MARHTLLSARLIVVGVGVAVAAAGSFVALHDLHRSDASRRVGVLTATAAWGDIRSTVGGLGRVVIAGQRAVTAPSTAGGAGSSASSTSTSTSTSQAVAPPGAVFAPASGHIARYLIAPGQHVAAGQAVALLDDGGIAAAALEQARADLASARLELAQKRISDPVKGLPPSAAELSAARLAIRSARARLGQLSHPTRADMISARVDVHKALADLATLRRGAGPGAIASAQSAIDAATQRLDQVSGPPTPQDVSAVQLEIARAQAELDALRVIAPGPSVTALEVAQLAVSLAQQRLAELPATAPKSDILAAQLDVKRATADLEALQKSTPPASASALAAAQAALDLAKQRFAVLTGPPNVVAVATVRAELSKAHADLALLRRGPLSTAVDAGQLAVALARQKLFQLFHPARAARDVAQLDIASARAALQTLRRRGGPATPRDIEIARLKVEAAASRLAFAELQAGRLTARAPEAGTVTSLLSSPGAPADVSTPIATVADLGHLAVTVDLSEFDAAHVREGLTAVISVDALGGKRIAGTVEFEAFVGVDSGGVVTFPTRIRLARTAAIKPGMNVSVKIVVAERRHVIVVPLEAVTHSGGHAVVTVVGTDGRTATRVVRLGLATNKDVEIRSGVKPGDRVAVGGGRGGV